LVWFAQKKGNLTRLSLAKIPNITKMTSKKCVQPPTSRIYSPSSSDDEGPNDDEGIEDTSSSSSEDSEEESDTVIENLRMENRNLRQNNAALDTLAKDAMVSLFAIILNHH